MYKDTMKNHWIDGGFKTRWLRDNVDFPLLDETCWHCTYCQENISRILYKLQSSSYREYDRPRIANKACFLDRARTRQYLIDRPNHELRYIPDNYDGLLVRTEKSTSTSSLCMKTFNAEYLDVDRNEPL